jgi:MarR family transcriptional regulator, transcriptional regulator for hemolysin
MKPPGTPIGLKLARASKAVSQAFSAALASEGGSIPAWLILNSLVDTDWRSQRDLARALGIEGPTLTRHLDGLERGGFVRRVPDPTDRRIQRLELTDDGRAAQQRMLRAVIQFNQQLLSGLSGEELAQLRDLLDRLVVNVGEQAIEGVPT